MVQRRHLCLLSLLLGLSLTGMPAAADLTEQRAEFVKAEKALQRGELKEFNRLKAGLRDYPLYPYLEYQALLRDLAKADPKEITAFLDSYAATPLAERLRARWLDQLAKRGSWSDYLDFYQPSSDVRRRCQQLQALIATGESQAAFDQVPGIWLYGKSRPSACDPVFAAWTEAGYRTPDMIWQRIDKAMEASEWRLAKYLGRTLSDTDRVWLKRWIDLHRNPDGADDSGRFAQPHPYREAMLSHAVRRLARWDGPEARELWQRVKPRYGFTPEQIQRTEHYIVRNLVRSPGEEDYAFIRQVAVGSGDLAVHEARIRAALRREDWRQVLRWIADLPKAERDQEGWMYWSARALEGVGETTAAKAVYGQVAKDRGYYGFLAADRIGVDYHLTHTETPVSQAQIDQIAALDAIARVDELSALRRHIGAGREWRDATRDMSAVQLKAAAKLAEQRGWHDRAIFALARTGYWDDLELRFPLEHAELVEENASRQGIDDAWVFAVMRQESAFMNNARSHAGAMGLMQLMPATARSVARKVLRQAPPRRHELLEPDTNIALGSAYLRQVKSKLGGSTVLATAAYNAGPHRVTRWLPEKTLPADIWIELVPFPETRGYLRRVLAYMVIYEKRMGKDPTRLAERLHPVPPDVEQIRSAQAGKPVASAS
jgi:soluble lytic murein transglycosylase